MGRLEVLAPVLDLGRGKGGRDRHMCQRACTERWAAEAPNTNPPKTAMDAGLGKTAPGWN